MTSKQTNEEIYKILSKHLDPWSALVMLTELSEVKGNKSFNDSIQNLIQIVTEKIL